MTATHTTHPAASHALTPAKGFSLLIKPASADCNLRCEYCFYLPKSELYPDSSIHRMSDEVLERLVSSYMASQQPAYTFCWQGGEPTLMRTDFFRKAVDLQKKHGKPGVTVMNGLQTNGTLIDDEMAALFANYRFLLGVSLDGPPDIHDTYRLAINGRGSHSDVIKGIECLRRNNVEFNILTLVSAANIERGVEVYRYLRDEGFGFHQYIPCVEFDNNGAPLPYTITGEQWGDFLCGIFDEWIRNDTKKVSIRLFDTILSYLVDGVRNCCTIQRDCCAYFMIEHNGDVYPCDFFVEEDLKLGNIMQNSWEELLANDLYRDFGSNKTKWNPACEVCPYLELCSGDCPKERYRLGRTPTDLSWLCPGWKKFYQHTVNRFRALATTIHEDRRRQTSSSPIATSTPKPRRNTPCPCGSGQKYKKCCGRNVSR